MVDKSDPIAYHKQYVPYTIQRYLMNIFRIFAWQCTTVILSFCAVGAVVARPTLSGIILFTLFLLSAYLAYQLSTNTVKELLDKAKEKLGWGYDYI